MERPKESPGAYPGGYPSALPSGYPSVLTTAGVSSREVPAWWQPDPSGSEARHRGEFRVHSASRLASLDLSAVRSLTDRDVMVCCILGDHRVLTTDQLVRVAFVSTTSAQHRLVTLHRKGILERFRPWRTSGTAPFHYLLGDLGARVYTEIAGRQPTLSKGRVSILGLSRSPRLTHDLAVNEFFTLLVARSRQDARYVLHEWWSESRCARAMGGVVVPDGYGVWQTPRGTIEFCLEVDRSTESSSVLRRKLVRYEQLYAETAVRRWVLFVVPGPARMKGLLETASPEVPIAIMRAGDDPSLAVWRTADRPKDLDLGELA